MGIHSRSRLDANRIALLTDVLVIGAGPAGAVAAHLLASWGHRVIVIDRPGGDAGRLAESIPPSATKILRTVGALDTVNAAGFLPWQGNTVWWGDEEARVEGFPAGIAGYQVVRHAFDRCLRDAAVQSGAVIQPGRVREVHVGTEVFAIVESASGPDRITARILIDASGRPGVIARHGLRVPSDAPHTIAIAGVWRSATPWPIPHESHTLVVAYADGWAWSVPTKPGERHFSVMIDPSRTELARRVSSRGVYLAELAKVKPFAPILAEATLVDGPWGADASVYSASQYAGEGFLLVGDAGSAIDPLSSFGVKKALASAWLGAVAAHTALVDPAMARHAFEFFNQREHALFASAQHQAAAFATEAAARSAHPFWTARAESSVEESVDPGPDVSALARDPDVLEAFANLRAHESVQFAPGPHATLAPRCIVRGREIVLEDHVILPGWPSGVRYLRDVDLVEVMRLAPLHRDVGDLFEAARRSAPSVALPDFLGALSVLIARGALVIQPRQLR